jgi:hypothetical protein
MQSRKPKLSVAPTKTPYIVYLPSEGLQGEDIPSNITWQDLDVDSIKVTFREPLKVKEIFNASNYEVKKNEVLAKGIEVKGYLGMSFETSKINQIETELPIDYVIQLRNGDQIKEHRNIRLFKPQLRVRLPKNNISIEPKTSYVKGRLDIKNIGRGLLIIRMKAASDSQCKTNTPREYQEWASKFNIDIIEELTALSQEFGQFKPFMDYLVSCNDKEYLDMTDEEKEEFKRKITDLATLLASDRNLLRGFAESYARVLMKNNQFQDALRKVITVYESLVTKDILLLNPLDEVLVENKGSTLKLEILITDNVYDNYKDVILPEIRIEAEPNTRVPIYKMVDWS